MSFTVKDICSELSLPKLEIFKMSLGTFIRDSYKARTGNDPKKVKEDDMIVNSYPDSFRIEAEALRDECSTRFLTTPVAVTPQVSTETVSYSIPSVVEPLKKKRKRIVTTAYQKA